MKLHQLVVARQDIFPILALLKYPDYLLTQAGDVCCEIQVDDSQLNILKRSNFKYREINL